MKHSPNAAIFVYRGTRWWRALERYCGSRGEPERMQITHSDKRGRVGRFFQRWELMAALREAAPSRVRVLRARDIVISVADALARKAMAEREIGSLAFAGAFSDRIDKLCNASALRAAQART